MSAYGERKDREMREWGTQRAHYRALREVAAKSGERWARDEIAFEKSLESTPESLSRQMAVRGY